MVTYADSSASKSSRQVEKQAFSMNVDVCKNINMKNAAAFQTFQELLHVLCVFFFLVKVHHWFSSIPMSITII